MRFDADRRCVIIISFLLSVFVFPLSGFAGTLPKGFVYVKDVIPGEAPSSPSIKRARSVNWIWERGLIFSA